MRYWNLLFFLLLASTATGENCRDLENADQRLACFDRASRCQDLHNEQQRLACYKDVFASRKQKPAEDRKAQVLQQEELTASISQEEKAPKQRKQAKPATQKKKFWQIFRRKEREKIDLVARVTDITVGLWGALTITLDNDQIWEEINSSNVECKVGDTVKITSGVLGSTDLRVEGRTGTTKVRKVE